MNISMQKKKKEAVERMKLFGIYSKVVQQFERSGIINQSEPGFYGGCFELSEESLQRVRKFEAEHNALVYHVIHDYTNLGEMECYLYVSDYAEDWEQDRYDIEHGQQCAMVYNLTYPECSEMGYIGVKLSIGAGLCRTY